MNDLQLATTVVTSILIFCGIIGFVTKWNLDKKAKQTKKLSKKQKRELEN